MEVVINEIFTTVQGLWGVLSNYQVDIDSISTWWEEQYGNLGQNGGWTEDSGAIVIPVLLDLFNLLMPAATTVTEVVETTLA